MSMKQYIRSFSLIFPTSGDLITVDLVLLLLRGTVCEHRLVLKPVMGWSAVRAGK